MQQTTLDHAPGRAFSARLRFLGGLAACALLLPSSNLPGQAEGAAGDEIFDLSPFTVDAAEGSGYQAAATLVGGRLSMSLSDVPVSVSVLTREFLNDIGATDFQTSAKWLASADVDGDNRNPFNDYGVSIRGFRSGFPYRNFFISYINTDSYAIERLDSARGPNALVFGDTKVGGTVNTTTKQARAEDAYSLEYRVSTFGGAGRFSFDANTAVAENFWVRVTGLYSDEDDWVDFSGVKRKGLYGTFTYKPFKNTTVRVDAEAFKQVRAVFGFQVFDNLSNWDTTTTYTGAVAPVAGSGTSRISTSRYNVFVPGNPELGVQNYQNFNTTTGTGVMLDTEIPPFQKATFPTIPDYEYNLRFGNAEIEQPYRNISAYIEQRIGDNLFVELAYSHSFNERAVDQFVTSPLYVDINRNLPDGSTNPNFGKRYSEASPIWDNVQSNELDEVRLTLAYVLRTDFADHRLLAGGGWRLDAYRNDKNAYLVLDEPGLKVGNPFAGANSPYVVRLRIYEDQRGIDFTTPPGSRYAGFTFFPGEDKELTYGQLAASSHWLKDRRLHTLVGVRVDKLETEGVSSILDSTTGELIGINENQPGREFDSVDSISAGASYELTKYFTPYANYAEGFDTSNAGLMLNPATGQPGDPLPAKSSKGYEFGVRYSFMEGKIQGALAYYKNEQTNDSNTGVTFPRNEINRLWNIVDEVNPSPRQVPTNPTEVIDYEGTGFEFDLIANPTPNWRLTFNIALPETEIVSGWARTKQYVANNIAEWEAKLASLTAANDSRRTAFNNDLNTVRSRLVTVSQGYPLVGTFDMTANFFANYTISEGRFAGLRIGGGFNYRGERLVSNSPTVPTDESTVNELKTDSYILPTITLGYRTRIYDTNVDFQLNIDNPFDQEIKSYTSYNLVNDPNLTPAPVFAGNNYYLQAPRKVTFSVKVDF